MRILLLNGSLRRERSSSLKVARAFVNGIIEETDAICEEIHLRDKDIHDCYGCFNCWKTTPGMCVIRDDMDELRSKVLDADIIIEAFPLYFFGMPSKMKAFTDRMIPYVSEYRAVPNGEDERRFLHDMRYKELMSKKLVLVSTCGYETTNNCYEPLIAQFDRICGVGNYTTVLAPQGGMLSEETLQSKIDKFLLKYKAAGREFAQEGKLSETTWNNLQIPMLGHNTFSMIINMNWDTPGVGPYGKQV